MDLSNFFRVYRPFDDHSLGKYLTRAGVSLMMAITCIDIQYFYDPNKTSIMEEAIESVYQEQIDKERLASNTGSLINRLL